MIEPEIITTKSGLTATLYCGDCLEILPTMGRVDAVITDPPYGINGGSGTVGLERAHKHAYESFEDTPENIERLVVPAVIAALRCADGRGVVTPGPKCMTLYPSPTAYGTLRHPATCSLSMWGRAQSQPIFYYGRPPHIGKDIKDTSFEIRDAASPGHGSHPCPKPLKTMLELVELAAYPGHTILDPFMGSGTTGVAALRMGCSFIGIEIERQYYEIAKRRIAAEAAQGKMF